MKIVKKILAQILTLTMITIMLIGCSAANQTVVTINNEKVSESLYRIYLKFIQIKFESLTPDIWDMELEGKKTEDVAKERALDSIKLSVAAKQKAKELAIELSKEDKVKIKEMAKKMMEEEQEFKDLNIKGKDVEEFYSYGILIEKVIQKISESYIPNEEEIKAEIKLIRESYENVTVKHILIGNKDEQGQDLPQDKMIEARALAEDILQKALKGEDMAKLAAAYSEDPGSKDTGGEYTFSRGQMAPEFENASFEGEVGRVYPSLVETSYGYHIIKVEDHQMGDEDQIKEDSIKNIKQRFADNELNELSAAMEVEKEETYNDIHILRSDADVLAVPETTQSNIAIPTKPSK